MIMLIKIAVFAAFRKAYLRIIKRSSQPTDLIGGGVFDF
jgi:hypothetical protein